MQAYAAIGMESIYSPIQATVFINSTTRVLQHSIYNAAFTYAYKHMQIINCISSID